MLGRPPTPSELRLLDALVAQDPRSERLLTEALGALVVPSCGCGCGSIGFLYGDHLGGDEQNPVLFPIEGEALNEHGESIGGLLLFVRNDRPHDLEVYGYTDEPLPLPDPDRVRWVRRPSV